MNRKVILVLCAWALVGNAYTALAHTESRPEVLLQSSHKGAIEGRIVDKNGDPLPGVTIRVRGMNGGFITDNNGKFTINNLENKDLTLTFSYIGFKTKTMTAKAGSTLRITLEDDVNVMNEVVVTGFVSKAKNSYTGAQITVKRDELLSMGTKNVIQSLAAFVPGMTITDNNAVGSNPNAKAEINIRGRASFEGAANTPVFVVDGTEVSYDYVYDMDMNDIESVTVLKDASASALYGAKASAGVIVITTKVLKGGRLKLNYSGTLRITAPDLSGYDLLNAAEKLEYERLAGLWTVSNSITDQYARDVEYNRIYQDIRRGVDTDWLRKPLRIGVSQNHSISVDGGDDRAKYNVGVRYGKEEGVMKDSSRDRLSGTFRLTYNVPNRFNFSNSTTINVTKSEDSPYGSYSLWTSANPYESPYDENGEYRVAFEYERMNPLYEASLGSFSRADYLSLLNTTTLRWWFNQNLRIDGDFSYTRSKDNSSKFVSPLTFDELQKSDVSQRGSMTENHNQSTRYSGKLMLSYNKTLFDKLLLTTMVGTNVESTSSDNYAFEGIGYYSDKLAHIGFSSNYPASSKPTGGDELANSVGFFANANAIYDNRYFLDVIYRYEGSSRFGRNQRFAPFWSVGGGWNLHNESFFRKNRNINLLKLRASVGYLGNMSFSPYQAMTTYSYSQGYDYIKGRGAIPMTIGNPDLKWERTLSTNVGVDLTFFRGRWDFSMDYYYKNTDNLLLNVTKAPSVGVLQARENLGAVENRGIEFQTKVVPIQNKDWYWALSMNYSYNKNKIKRISNALRAQNEANQNNTTTVAPLPIYEEGESLTVLKVVPSAGLDPATGREIYIKRDGTHTFTYDAQDKVKFGDTSPWASGRISSYLTYKKLSLNLSFNYSLGAVVYNETLATRVEGSNPRYNADQRVFDSRWRQPGDNALYKDIADSSVPKQTSRFVATNNYLNLSTLSVAYDFTPDFLKRVHVRSLRMELLANDLLYLSSVKRERGLDYPFSRSVELSLRFSF